MLGHLPHDFLSFLQFLSRVLLDWGNIFVLDKKKNQIFESIYFHQHYPQVSVVWFYLTETSQLIPPPHTARKKGNLICSPPLFQASSIDLCQILLLFLWQLKIWIYISHSEQFCRSLPQKQQKDTDHSCSIPVQIILLWIFKSLNFHSFILFEDYRL